MGSLLRKLKKAKQIIDDRKKEQRRNRRNSDATNSNGSNNMVSKKNLVAFRLIMGAFFMVAIVQSGYAPNKAPKLPEGVSVSFVPSRRSIE